MMNPELSRRALGLSLAAVAAAQAPSASASGMRALDLVTPEGQLDAFVKLFLTKGSGRIWYWYTGMLTSAPAGGPIRPLIAVDTLIRRDVRQTGSNRYEVENFEANYYHAAGDHTPLMTFHNSLNGRVVEPQHYREGPYTAVYSPVQPYLLGSPPAAPQPFTLPWRQVGDEVWDTVEYYSDVPHPLPMDVWRLESSGPQLVDGSFATHTGRYDELADPAVVNARCTFNYEAVMGWLPWLLMGQTPGNLVWRANGRKLLSLGDVPAASIAGFKAVHPGMFEERPWVERSNMWIDYRKDRKPAS